MTPKKFKAWRRRHGLSQAGAAERLRISVDTVKSWEIGRRKIGSLAEQACELHDLVERYRETYPEIAKHWQKVRAK